MPPKVKVEKGVAVKKEKVTVKKELADGSSRTGVKARLTKKFDQHKHYRHQVAFLNEALKPPWKICFGALGTGIIGIEPKKTSSSSSSGTKVKKEPDESEVPSRIPAGATVVLLLNAPLAGVQGRNGNSMGGYGDMLDVQNRSLHWKSQRSDCKGHKIGAIVSHQQNGGRLVVGVRNCISAAVATDSAKFKLLGAVSRIDNVQDAKFLVQDGSFVICDGAKLHKAITTACLDAGLRAGIGLVPKRYPLADSNAKDYKCCKACCYTEANARLHFEELSEEGVATYTGGRPRKGKHKVKGEPSDASQPRKRLRCKTEPTDESNSVIKQEQKEDDSDDDPEGSEAPFTLGMRVQRCDNGRDWGTGYVVTLDPLEVTAKDDPASNGYQWDNVRHIPKGKGRPAKKKPVPKAALGRMQAASARKSAKKASAMGVARAWLGSAGSSSSKLEPASSGGSSQTKLTFNAVVKQSSEPAETANALRFLPKLDQLSPVDLTEIDSQRLPGGSDAFASHVFLSLSAPLASSAAETRPAEAEACATQIDQPSQAMDCPPSLEIGAVGKNGENGVVRIDVELVEDCLPPVGPADVVGIDVE